MSISFYSADVPIPLKNRKQIKTILTQIISKEKKEVEYLNYIFSSDDYLLEINRIYLSHDFYTDVITFDLSIKPKTIMAEVYISLQRVKENANAQNSSFKEELLRVMVHGILHLCGYRDKTKREITIMREAENEYLRLFEF